jgi:hypothetical protein
MSGLVDAQLLIWSTNQDAGQLVVRLVRYEPAVLDHIFSSIAGSR